ncbi:MAG: ribosome silencing factor [Pseudolabrys sp.]
MKGQAPLPTSALSRTPKKKAAEAASSGASAPQTLRIVLASLDNMKAEDTVSIDITGKSSIGDHMVVTSGRSQRHVASIADEVVKDLHKAGVTRVRVEGQRVGDWVLIDAGDVIVHVFRPEIRIFYNLEKMWSGRAGDARPAN